MHIITGKMTQNAWRAKYASLESDVDRAQFLLDSTGMDEDKAYAVAVTTRSGVTAFTKITWLEKRKVKIYEEPK